MKKTLLFLFAAIGMFAYAVEDEISWTDEEGRTWFYTLTDGTHTDIPEKSLHRMLSRRGIPSVGVFGRIAKGLQDLLGFDPLRSAACLLSGMGVLLPVMKNSDGWQRAFVTTSA